MNEIFIFKMNVIRGLRSSNVTVGTENVLFSFPAIGVGFRRFKGLVLIRIANAFTAPAAAVPVQFQFNDNIGSYVLNVTGYNGEAVTSETLLGTGVYLAFVDGGANSIQLMTGVGAAAAATVQNQTNQTNP